MCHPYNTAVRSCFIHAGLAVNSCIACNFVFLMIIESDNVKHKMT